MDGSDNAPLDERLTECARIMGFTTLEVRRADHLDFRDVGVSDARKALLAAYVAGVASKQTDSVSDVLWVLHIRTRYGQSFWLRSDEQLALDRLAQYARAEWDESDGEIAGLNDGEVISAYFGRRRLTGYETYTIEQVTLDGE